MDYFHVDAFCDQAFKGNPAAVCVLPQWLPDSRLQLIAEEHHLPVTAFLVAKLPDYEIRWFTPQQELDLCGHGTLAAAFVIFNRLAPEASASQLHSIKAGVIAIKRVENGIQWAFPIKPITPIAVDPAFCKAFAEPVREAYQSGSERLMLVFDDPESLERLQPDIHRLKQTPWRGIIITAPATETDFVSRTFYPGKVVPEDAVTGASHCVLAPYWAKRLAKTQLSAKQVSARGGTLTIDYQASQLWMTAQAVLYSEGKIL